MTLKCKCCESDFTAIRISAKFCSTRCRVAYHRKTAQQKTTEASFEEGGQLINKINLAVLERMMLKNKISFDDVLECLSDYVFKKSLTNKK